MVNVLSSSIGQRIYQLRVEDREGKIGQITLNQLLSALSEVGIEISRGKLSNIERGLTEPSLSLLIGIAAALSSLRKKPIYLHDLLPESGQISVSPKWSCDSTTIRGFMNGEPVISDLIPSTAAPTEELSPSVIRSAKRINQLLNDPEYRNSPVPKKPISVTPESLNTMILKKYGHDLDDEALKRAKARAAKAHLPTDKITWQAKGRETAGIVEELVLLYDESWQKKPYRKRRQ